MSEYIPWRRVPDQSLIQCSVDFDGVDDEGAWCRYKLSSKIVLVWSEDGMMFREAKRHHPLDPIHYTKAFFHVSGLLVRMHGGEPVIEKMPPDNPPVPPPDGWANHMENNREEDDA